MPRKLERKNAGCVPYFYDHKTGTVKVYVIKDTKGKEKNGQQTAPRLLYTFPKGKIEKNETPEKAALRETKEEAGVTGKLVPKPLLSKEVSYQSLEQGAYEDPKNVHTTMYALLVQEYTHSQEKHLMRLDLTIEEAMGQLRYQWMKDVLNTLQSFLQNSQLIWE